MSDCCLDPGYSSLSLHWGAIDRRCCPMPGSCILALPYGDGGIGDDSLKGFRYTGRQPVPLFCHFLLPPSVSDRARATTAPDWPDRATIAQGSALKVLGPAPPWPPKRSWRCSSCRARCREHRRQRALCCREHRPNHHHARLVRGRSPHQADLCRAERVARLITGVRLSGGAARWDPNRGSPPPPFASSSTSLRASL